VPFPRLHIPHNTVNAFTKAIVSALEKSQLTQTNNMQEIQFCQKKLQFYWVVLGKRWNFLNILHKEIFLKYLHFHIWNFFNIFYQVASLSCLSVPPLPLLLKQAAAATLAGTIYVCGGYSTSSLQTQSACWSWQPGEKGWQAAQPLVKSRWCFTITTLGNVMGMLFHNYVLI